MCAVWVRHPCRAPTKSVARHCACNVKTLMMRSTLVLLSLFGLAHSVQIYFHPPIAVIGSLPDSHAGALVAKHLHLDRFEPLQEFDIEPLDQTFVGKGSHSSLLIGIDNDDAECQLN